MPRVNVPVTQITRTGIPDTTPIVGDAVNNHSLINDGSVWIEAENAGAVSRTVSILFANTVDGVTVDAKTWSIPAGARRRIGPFPVRLYGATLQVNVDNAELELSAYRVAGQA
ncbi:hypothetical protein ACFU76_04535 [Streptomyces sp. NPDC057539]|uniref:hypothetical protein n=1 Tax=Streptomyces sp. NPDC057539 TaxID=3346159 RepID=UPI0036BF884E